MIYILARINLHNVFFLPRKLRSLFYIPFNRVKFTLLGAKIGKNFRVYNKFYLLMNPTSTIEIGDNFTFTNGEAYNPLCRNIRGCIYTSELSQLKIGNNVGISSACIWVKENIVIGNNVMIGGDSVIMDTDAHNLDYLVRRNKYQNVKGSSVNDYSSSNSKPINIGDDVLIGTRSIILKGVSIGARSIIGAGSVVVKSIPSDCIAGGNPCRVIRYL